LVAVACSRQPPAPEAAPPPSHEARNNDSSAHPPPSEPADADQLAASGVDASTIDDDPMATHFMSQAELLHLVPLPPAADDRASTRRDSLLAYLVAPIAGHFNDGNRALAHHEISRAKCLAGLKGETLQTDEQRAICKDEDYMVPVYANGNPRSAKVCIDQFEFPNAPCELPFVWGSPSEADALCRVQGKRLCTQQEWSLACSADPKGKAKRTYAYGDKLDLAICNTSIPHEMGPDGKMWRCYVHDATTTWNTCSTDTEPAGAFPRCRSRLGVFDQHGNVAEMMTREEGGEIFTQLKGSAFFYIDVAREPGKTPLHPERESYPDNCGYDPRWHVEKLAEALHSNYHLGFRCCKEL
jgi:sulfatase-modifying factor enzyme 1